MTIAFCFIFVVCLACPAFATDVPELDFQYVFSEDFTFADIERYGSTDWYSIPFDVSSVADKVNADYVIFSIDNYEYKCKFKVISKGRDYHYIGNPSVVFGVDDGTEFPFFLLIDSYSPSVSRLYIGPPILGPLYRGDKTSIHVAVSVAYHEATPTGFISSIFDVFSYIGGFVIGLLNSVTGLFWFVNGSGEIKLTLLGVLSLVALGVSLVFLLLRVIRNFLHFRS